MSMDKRALQIRGLGAARAVLASGQGALFEIHTEDGASHTFSAHHATLDLVIHDLQALAQDARQQRAFGASPEAKDLPMARKANLASKIDVALDAAGKSALWRGTHEDGLVSEVQLSATLLESLLDFLPKHVAELKSRRRQSGAPN